MFVALNRLTCTLEYAEHLERAFAHAGQMDGVPGFKRFQFLRSAWEGEERTYIAVTEWEDRAAYEAWTRSESFSRSHRGSGDASPIQATLELFETLS